MNAAQSLEDRLQTPETAAAEDRGFEFGASRSAFFLH
jgi:hypothetical protein